ncbi:hypothetical protein GQ457_16G009230 [Hibiscus cannabinus]
MHARATKCVFLGYPKNIKGYRLYDLQSKIVFTLRDVVFSEHIFPFQKDSVVTHKVVLPEHDNKNALDIIFHKKLVKNTNTESANSSENFQRISSEQNIAHTNSDSVDLCSSNLGKNANNFLANISPEISSQVSKETSETSNEQSSVQNVLHEVSTEAILPRSARPVRQRHLPLHLKDYQVAFPKARTSSHYIDHVMSYHNFTSKHLSYVASIEVLPEPNDYRLFLFLGDCFSSLWLTSTLVQQGFQQTQSDASLFTKGEGTNFIALLIYVDDVVLASPNHNEILSVKNFLHESFKIKDLGNLKFFLGFEVARSSKESKPVSTHILPNNKISKQDGVPLDSPTSYRKLIGKLIYLTNTRPDIAFAVQHLSQFLSAPTDLHLMAVHRILRYLKGTPGQGIFFSNR